MRGFEAVLDHLTDEILNGSIGPGERLPNERDLATDLQVSRSAVREAIKVLQAQGVLTSRTGPHGGTRVATHQDLALGRMLKLHVALDAVSFDELTETRVVLERAAAEAAAENLTDADAATLASLVSDMEETSNPERFNELDTAFHVAIAGVGANRLVRDITVAIREAVATPILQAERRLASWRDLHEQLNREHRGILEALVRHDGPTAAQRCESHIRNAHRSLLV